MQIILIDKITKVVVHDQKINYLRFYNLLITVVLIVVINNKVSRVVTVLVRLYDQVFGDEDNKHEIANHFNVVFLYYFTSDFLKINHKINQIKIVNN